MSFKYVLFQEVGKSKTRREAVRANSLPMLVRSLYVGLHTQKGPANVCLTFPAERVYG